MPRVTITVPEKNAQPYRFQLDRECVTLGRGSENDIAIDCGSVSVRHAEMKRVKGGYELWDLGSTNGIKLDGERYEMIPLQSGISVNLGDVAFDFVLSDEELEALAREQADDESPIIREEEEEATSDLATSDEVLQSPAARPGGCGLGIILLLILLAAAAFVAGMAIRFQKETGGSLIDAIQAKRHTTKGATPAPKTPGSSATEERK